MNLLNIECVIIKQMIKCLIGVTAVGTKVF